MQQQSIIGHWKQKRISRAANKWFKDINRDNHITFFMRSHTMCITYLRIDKRRMQFCL